MTMDLVKGHHRQWENDCLGREVRGGVSSHMANIYYKIYDLKGKTTS
jgi:hypothetical protein